MEEKILTQEDIIRKYRIDELEKCLDMIEDDLANKINGMNYKTNDSFTEIILRCVGKSMLTFHELIVLCKNGFPDGALGLSRNIYEQFMIVSRFECEKDNLVKQDLVQKYNADYEIQRCKNLKKMYEYAGEEKEVRNCKSIIERYKKQFKVKNFRDYWWSGTRDFASLCSYIIEQADIDMNTMLKNLHLSYKQACLVLHACNLGNANRVCDTYPDIDLSPSDEGQELALDLAIKSFILVAMIAYRELGLDSNGAKEKLNELAFFYQEIINANENII